MVFNSIEYFVFLLAVLLFLSVFSAWDKRYILLVASIIFYGFWKPIYLWLLFGSTVVDFIASQAISKSTLPTRRKKILYSSLLINVSILCYFKYYLALEITNSGIKNAFFGLDYILPLGISFYTFQTMGYTIDVYRRQAEPTKSIISLAVFASFFPQLIAGPIERFTYLMPQLKGKVIWKSENYLKGIRWVLVALFKKCVIVDRLDAYVSPVYADLENQNSLSIILATYLFAFQVYCDFSAYTSIARGSAALIGIELSENFKRPFFANSMRDFWKRWHMSFFRWLKDYIYLPLGGRKSWKTNVVIIFLISGIWHGLSWNFLLWGLVNALILISENAIQKRFPQFNFLPKKLEKWFLHVYVFHFFCVGLLLFRSESIADVHLIFQILLSGNFEFSDLHWGIGGSRYEMVVVLFSILCLLICEYYQESRGYFWEQLPRNTKTIIYYLLILGILIWGWFDDTSFIYFEF